MIPKSKLNHNFKVISSQKKLGRKSNFKYHLSNLISRLGLKECSFFVPCKCSAIPSRREKFEPSVGTWVGETEMMSNASGETMVGLMYR